MIGDIHHISAVPSMDNLSARLILKYFADRLASKEAISTLKNNVLAIYWKHAEEGVQMIFEADGPLSAYALNRVQDQLLKIARDGYAESEINIVSLVAGVKP